MANRLPLFFFFEISGAALRHPQGTRDVRFYSDA
jgi:hypothetical protein